MSFLTEKGKGKKEKKNKKISVTLHFGFPIIHFGVLEFSTPHVFQLEPFEI